MKNMNLGRSKVTPSSQPVIRAPAIQFYWHIKNGSNRIGCFRQRYVNCDVAIRHPYVGIIQIRLSVEGFTFLSACNTSSRLLNCNCIIQLIIKKCKKNIFYCRKVFLKLGCAKVPSNSKQVKGICKVMAYLPSTHREFRIFYLCWYCTRRMLQVMRD